MAKKINKRRKEYRVSTHAINQFRSRIAHDLTYHEALTAILNNLKTNIVKAKPQKRKKDNICYIYVDGDYTFRAVINNGVVVTVTKWQ